MSNVIQFLASMGASAPMARMSMEEYEAAIATLDAGDRTLQAPVSYTHLDVYKRQPPG